MLIGYLPSLQALKDFQYLQQFYALLKHLLQKEDRRECISKKKKNKATPIKIVLINLNIIYSPKDKYLAFQIVKLSHSSI